MNRYLPQPLISAALLLAWLALNNSIQLAHWLLGALFALAIPWLTRRITTPASPRVRHPLVIGRLVLTVFIDIIRSNFTVVMLILVPPKNQCAAFVRVPLALTDAHAKTVLAAIITLTPSTLSADFSEDGRELCIHALNVQNAAALVADIQSRYETPLMKIFEA